MKGRLESELLYRKEIDSILSDLPYYVEDLYMIMQVQIEASSCLTYIRRIRHFFESCNIKKPSEINTRVVARYFDTLNFTTDKDGELKKTSKSYRCNSWTALNHLFKYMVEEGLMEKNPLTVIKRPKDNDNVEKVFLNEEQIEKMLFAAKNNKPNQFLENAGRIGNWGQRDYLIIVLLLATGMRRSALSQINVEDYSFKTKQLTVIDKRDKMQVYDIPPKIESLIKEWLKTRRQILGDVKCDAMFISERRRRICSKTVSRITEKYSEMAFGEKMSAHKTRRYFITDAYKRSGNDLEAARIAAGHESVSTTARYIEKSNSSRRDTTFGIVERFNI